MFNSTSDENISVSDVHIGLDTSHDLEYIEEEDYTNSTFEDLNNHTTKDYCQVNINPSWNWYFLWLNLYSNERAVVRAMSHTLIQFQKSND